MPQLRAMNVLGHCGTVANFAPELLHRYFETDDPKEQERLYRSLEAINGAVCGKGYPGSGKYVLQKRGLHLTTVTRALTRGALTDEIRQRLDAFLARFDFQHGLVG
jgi:dihydrodipicolinate synthase/N-acetylneuraminate lyase